MIAQVGVPASLRSSASERLNHKLNEVKLLHKMSNVQKKLLSREAYAHHAHNDERGNVDEIEFWQDATQSKFDLKGTTAMQAIAKRATGLS